MRTPHFPDLADGEGDADSLPPSGFELRLQDGRAFIAASGRPLGEGIVARRFRMEVPRIKFPFDLTGGADRFRDQRCFLRELELSVDAASIGRLIASLVSLEGLADGGLQVAARPGFLEIGGRHPLAGSFTAKVAVEVAADAAGSDGLLGFFLYDFRLYQPGPLSAAELIHRFATNLRPPLVRREPLAGGGIAADVLTPALRQLLVARGFRLPETRGVALRRAHVLSGQLVLEFEEHDLPSSPPSPGELLAREGQRAFAEVEALIAAGELSKAREALRDLSQVEGHPFAAERFLQLLVTDPSSHDLALDLCALLRRRSPVPAVALWVEGLIRETNEEWLQAASCFLDLAELSLAERGLFAAALAARRAAELSIHGREDVLATRAYALWESAVPNDVDALLGLAEIAERRRDLPTALSALRRVSAFATDGAVSGAAHARLGRLLLSSTDDAPRARLHLDQALRQNPDDLQSLLALAQSCEISGELVRAVRLLDRGSRLAKTSGDNTLAVQLLGRSARIWNERLARPENALLRLREALALEPPDAQRGSLLASIAQLTRDLGLHAEALDAQRAVTRASAPGRPRAEALLVEARLLAEDPATRPAADQAIARALQESPGFLEAAKEWVRLRRGDSPAALQMALTAAAKLAEPEERAELLVERGELEAANPELGGAARHTFAEALEAAPDHSEALRLFAEASEREGDAAAACSAWLRLSEVSIDVEESAAFLRRLADVASRSPDASAVNRILRQAAEKVDAPLPVLLRLLEIERRHDDPEAQAALALRISVVADVADQPELALSVLIEQIDRVDTQDDVDRVRPLLNRAIELAPQDGHVRAAAVRLFRLDGDLEALRPALEAYLQTTEAQPIRRQLEIWRELAEVSLAIGQRREAIAAYEAIQMLDSQDRDAAEALVDLYALEGDGEAERRSLAALAELLVKQGDGAGAAARLMGLASLQADGAPEVALDHLRRALTLDRGAGPARALAEHAERIGHRQLASQTFAELAELEVEPPLKASALRRAAELSDDAEEARSLALRAHEADPESNWASLFAALTALEGDEGERAVRLARSVLSRETLEPGVDALLAQATISAAAYRIGAHEVEEQALRVLEAHDPEELAYPERRFVLLRETGGSVQKRAALLGRIAARLAPQTAADAFVEIGDGLRSAGDLEASLDAYRAALLRAPEHPAALIGLVRLLPESAERAELRTRALGAPAAAELLPAAERGAWILEEARAADSAQAGALWSLAAELLPEDPRPLEGLVAWLQAERRPREAAEARLRLAQRLSAAPAGEAYIAAAELFEQAGDVRAAADALAVGLEQQLPPERAGATWAHLARLRATLAEPEAERLALDQAVGLVAPAERSRIHLRRADLFREAGDREAERTALTQALLAGEQGIDVLERLRAASEALEDHEAVADALELLVQARAGEPAVAAATAVELAELALNRLQRPPRAEAAYRRALIFAPGHFGARAGLSEILIARGDPDSVGRALELLVEGLGLLPASERAAATVALADRAARLERADVSLRLLRSLRHDPELPAEGLVLGAELLYGAGATGEALDWMAAVADRPDASSERAEALKLRRVELLIDLGREPEALEAVLELLGTPPFDAAAIDLLIALLERGQTIPRERLEALTRQLAQRTRAARLLTVDAQARLTGDPRAAAEQLRSALKLEPTSDRRRALRAALEAAGDSAGLVGLFEDEALAAAETGDASATLAAWRALAQVARKAGEAAVEERALVALAAHLEQGKELASALHRVGELRMDAGDTPAALSSFLEAARQGGQAALERSEAVARLLGDGRSLAEVLELRLQGKGGDDRPALFGELAELYRGPLAAPELAERTLRRALAEGSVPASGLEALTALLREEGRRHEAAEFLAERGRELGARDPEEGAGLFDRAAAELNALGEAQAAIGMLQEGLALQRSPGRLAALADAMHAQGQTAEAASLDAEICDAEALPPFRVLERHAGWLRGQPDGRALAEFLERHAGVGSSGAEALLEAAATRRRIGDTEGELRALRAAFELDPAQPRAFAALVARGAASDATSWTELLRKRAAAVPSEAGPLLRSAGELLLQEGHLGEAAALYDEALQAAPVDPLALVGRVEVALVQGSSSAEWLSRLEAALAGDPVSDGVAAEAVPRALAALIRSGESARARPLLAAAHGLPSSVLESRTVLELRDQVAAALGDREEQRRVRGKLLSSATETDRPAALQRLLDVVEPEDSDAPAILREAFDLEGVPHSVALTERLLLALETSGSPPSFASFLEELLAVELLPRSTTDQRVEWARRAGELRWQLGDQEAGSRLFERALSEARGSTELLRTLAAEGLPPQVRSSALGQLAERAAPSERSDLLLQRAELAEALSPEQAAVAWEAVLREGPGGAGYLAAIERALTRAVDQGRESEVAELLVAKAEASEGGVERAQLLERAAVIRETKLGDVDGALELFRRAAAESGDVRWFTLLAEAYDRAGRTAEAAAALAVEVARREPGERRTERQRKLGLMLARDLGRLADALPHLRAVAEVDQPAGADDPALLSTLAEAAKAVGEPELELKALSRLATANPAVPEAQAMRRAELLQELGRGAEAGELLAELARKAPADGEIFLRLAGVLRDRKAWRDLGELIGTYLASAPELDPAVRLQLLRERAALANDLGEGAEAEKLFREVLAAAPTDTQALTGLRRLVDARGDQRELTRLLAAQLPLTTDDVELASLALQLGGLELRLGDQAAARDHLRLALGAAERAAPTFADRIRLPLAQVELALGNGRAALEQAEAGLTTGGEDRVALLAVAVQGAILASERLRALGHAREWLELRPGEPEALTALETLARDPAEPGVAAEALVQRVAHETDPVRKARALRDLADLREKSNDHSGAEAALREAVQLDPDDEEAFTRLRGLLEAESRYQELAEVLRERARRTDDDIVRAASLAEQGDLLRTQLHNPAGAAEAYQRSLEILPRASTSEGYAEALYALGQDHLAAEHYRRALAGGGHLGEFFLLYRLGALAARSGDKALALEQFMRACDANPSFLPAREALVEVAEELGKVDVALAALRGMAQLLDPGEFGEQLAEVQLHIGELEKRLLHFGPAGEALEKAAALLPKDRRPLDRLAALYQGAARWADAVRILEQLAELSEGAAAVVPLIAAAEITLDKLAEMERAAELYERVLAISPEQETARRRLMGIAAGLGNHARLLELAEPVLARYPEGTEVDKLPAWLNELFVPLAQAFQAQSRLEDAHRMLSYAHARTPHDLDLLSRQVALAKQIGRHGEEADLEEQLIGRIVEQKPLEAATRLRALARRVLEQNEDSERSRQLLERAADLAPARPEDRRLLADLLRRSEDPAHRREAMDAYLGLVRRDPSLDIVLLRTLAATADELDRPELAQTVHGLLQTLEHSPPGNAPTLTPLPQDAWTLGGGEGGIDHAVRALSPYLEPLFPSQLARYGIAAGDRVGPGHAPELNQWIDRARESLGARPVDVFLALTLKGVAVENTHPPSLIVGGHAVQYLGQGGLQWLICQRLALVELGFTLASKFSPRDVVTLVSLVALFLSENAPVPPAERQRLQAFLGALRRSCPDPVRQGLLEQNPRIARELNGFDPHRWVARATAKANQLALLVTGDLHSALEVLDYLDGSEGPKGNAWELPQGRALVDWAFSEEHLWLRRLSLGKPSE